MQNITFGKLIDDFAQTYGLGPANLYYFHHDAMHAITGFSPTMQDELRVFIFEKSMAQGKDARPEAKKHFRFIVENPLPGLNTGDTLLAREEMDALYELGRDVAQTVAPLVKDLPPFMEQEGFYKFSREELREQPLAALDFSAAAHAIKNKYQTETNRLAEERAVDIFRRSAENRGISPKRIAAPGQPWTKAFA